VGGGKWIGLLDVEESGSVKEEEDLKGRRGGEEDGEGRAGGVSGEGR
jgi:hypothetical protein